MWKEHGQEEKKQLIYEISNIKQSTSMLVKCNYCILQKQIFYLEPDIKGDFDKIDNYSFIKRSYLTRQMRVSAYLILQQIYLARVFQGIHFKCVVDNLVHEKKEKP
jgi:hypothetical protein